MQLYPYCDVMLHAAEQVDLEDYLADLEEDMLSEELPSVTVH